MRHHVFLSNRKKRDETSADLGGEGGVLFRTLVSSKEVVVETRKKRDYSIVEAPQ